MEHIDNPLPARECMTAPDQTAYPVELKQPDLAPYRSGNAGIPYPFTYDGAEAVTTPCAGCFLMFPTHKPRAGETAVRLGRYKVLDEAPG